MAGLHRPGNDSRAAMATIQLSELRRPCDLLQAWLRPQAPRLVIQGLPADTLGRGYGRFGELCPAVIVLECQIYE